MGAEDKPSTGDILPMPVNTGDSLPEVNSRLAELSPAAPETSGSQPVAPSLAGQNATVPLSLPVAPTVSLLSGDPAALSQSSPVAANNDQRSKDDLKRRYDDEARKIIGQYASDPYLETKKIEEIRHNYLRDVYNRNVGLPQAQQS